MTTQTHNSPKLTTADDLLQLEILPADYRLFYGTESSQFGDLYLPPASGPYPVVILIHGGCWQAQVGLDHLSQLCKAFTQEGYAVWSVEYRRLGDGGGWPMTFTDVATSADFLRQIAETHALNLSHVVAVGYSAGGHLALWLAGRHRLPADSPIYTATPLPLHGVVSLAGLPDLVEGVKRQLCGGACQTLMGGSPDSVPQRYQQGSPRELLPLGVLQWHIVGALDPIAPADYIQQFVVTATQYESVQLDILPEIGHFEFGVPTGQAWASVRHAVRSLMGAG
jgi:poly(3-hydroxybutyrate) depolymerase